jgi:hypothetical protein
MLLEMKIPSANQIPAVAHAAEWSRLFTVDQTTIFRAYKAGHLQRAKSKGRRALYTWVSIAKWLGLTDLAK